MADNITNSSFERPLLDAVSNLDTNADHELWLRVRILKYASLLHEEYGGDIDIICALSILRMSGVKYFEFSSVYNFDPVKIKGIFQEIGFPQEKAVAVLNNLNPQVDHLSDSIEAKIINDAFILASLGAAGLARFFMRNEYENLNIDEFSKIDPLFKERLSKLITSQGIRLAEKENKFIYLFSALLTQEPKMDRGYTGKYIILEGNSGTGKDSQAELIREYYENKGYEVSIIKEPSQIYRDFEAYIESSAKVDLSESSPMFRLYSIIGDRYNQVQGKVIQDLKKGKVVISVRSYISMLVYQCENEFERLLVNFVHSFVPRPDIIVLYDANEDICLQRVLARGTKMTPFDKFESLKKFRPLYLDIVKSHYFDFPFEIVDASGTLSQVAEETIKKISKYT
ncbi:MAG: hypothetical protein HY865_07555 [Chloroflexi bacterium]|nr:hypothetical protein [Chloroflexota bacterium]